MSSKLIKIISCFNGEERRVVARARTIGGVRRAVKRAASGNGWGVRIKGTKEALQKAGAFEVADSDGYFILPMSEKPDTTFLDCTVL